jgi:hypothetical protein
MNGVGLSKPKSVDNNHNWLILLNFISEMRKIEMSLAQCRVKGPFHRLRTPEAPCPVPVEGDMPRMMPPCISPALMALLLCSIATLLP